MARTRSVDDVGRLTGMMLEAALDHAQWPPLLEQLTQRLHGTTAGLIQHGSIGGTVLAYSGPFAECAAEYNAQYSTLDPWPAALQRRVRSLDRDFVVNSDRLLPFAEFAKTAFYNEYARRWEVGRVVCTGTMGGGVLTTLSVYRSHRKAPYGDQALTLVRRLMPAFRHTRIVHARFEGAVVRGALAERALDHLQSGVILFNSAGQVVFVNAVAARLAETGDAFRLHRQTVAVTAKQAQTSLAAMLRQAIGGGAIERTGGALSLPRSSGRAPLLAMVCPLSLSAQPNRHAAAMFINDPEACAVATEDVVQTLFGLNRTEARIAVACSEGLSTAEIADRLCLTRQTVQWYLKQACAKLDVRGQRQLARRLSHVPPLRPSRG